MHTRETSEIQHTCKLLISSSKAVGRQKKPPIGRPWFIRIWREARVGIELTTEGLQTLTYHLATSPRTPVLGHAQSSGAEKRMSLLIRARSLLSSPG